MDLKFEVIPISIPEGCNVILGQSHFIKTVEDLYEVLATSSTCIKFGLAFCEASGKRLVRSAGNDEELKAKAEEEALKIGAGHVFVIFIKDAYPINVLNSIKNVAEVCNIYCATANPLQVVVVESEQGRGIIGVIDGQPPVGVEKEEDVKERKEFLRNIGYKL
jgi:adenosine/AMP kinase